MSRSTLTPDAFHLVWCDWQSKGVHHRDCKLPKDAPHCGEVDYVRCPWCLALSSQPHRVHCVAVSR